MGKEWEDSIRINAADTSFDRPFSEVTESSPAKELYSHRCYLSLTYELYVSEEFPRQGKIWPAPRSFPMEEMYGSHGKGGRGQHRPRGLCQQKKCSRHNDWKVIQS